MRKQDFDYFCDENGKNNMNGIDDKWHDPTTEFCITQKVRQQSRYFSLREKKPVNTASISTMTEV